MLLAVNSAAANNGISPAPTSYYTDIEGDRLDPEVVVGSLGPGALPPATAYGVEAYGFRTFSTLVGGIFAALPGGSGINQLSASARATAIAGQVQGVCPADAPCGFLPVTFPYLLTLCDGSNNQIGFGQGSPYTFGNVGDPERRSNPSVLQTGPGSVGWLDVTPHDPSCNGNGSSFLACEILKPGNKGLDLPIWVHTVPGNANSTLVQTAMDQFIGEQVQIPSTSA